MNVAMTLPSPTLPASGEGAGASPASGGGWEGEVNARSNLKTRKEPSHAQG